MDKHVYFVRHGESDSNADRIHRGDGASLSEKGRQQADIVGERIKKIGVDALVMSPLSRTKETAEHILKHIDAPSEESALFVERRRPSAVTGFTFDSPEAVAVTRLVHEGYLVPGHRHSDEENLDDLRTRANDALAFLAAHDAERICVVTHGIFLRALFCAMLKPNFSGEDFRSSIDSLEIGNTAVSYVRFQIPWKDLGTERKWRIISWNDLAHLG